MNEFDMMTGPDFLPGMEIFLGFFGVIIVLAIVDMALKAWGMWRAARLDRKGWFICMMIFSTAGILPAIFLLLTKEEYAEHFTSKKPKKS